MGEPLQEVEQTGEKPTKARGGESGSGGASRTRTDPGMNRARLRDSPQLTGRRPTVNSWSAGQIARVSILARRMRSTAADGHRRWASAAIAEKGHGLPVQVSVSFAGQWAQLPQERSSDQP